MKLTFKNLGTIKETTLDLRPLTVIVGPNNTSKTYLAYCVHGLLSTLPAPPRISADFAPDGGETVVRLDELARDMSNHTRRGVRFFEQALPEFFQDTHGSLFGNTRLHISLDESDLRLAFQRLAAANAGTVEVTGDTVTLRDLASLAMNFLPHSGRLAGRHGRSLRAYRSHSLRSATRSSSPTSCSARGATASFGIESG
ncbi:MAG: hypothetical protein R3B70_03425 [Polyangiaceae bacterium]